MKIGIIGGGQLGMMMAESAIKLGYEIYSFDPSAECSIVQFSTKHFCGQYDDLESLKSFCSLVDVVTYEFENICMKSIEVLEKEFKIYPNSKALKYSQNRFVEKTFALKHGLTTANFNKVVGADNLNSIYKGNKCVLKTLTGGYDGKGQTVLNGKITSEALNLVSEYECILEEFVDYDYEASIVVSRDLKGNIVSFPVTVNTHKNGILYKSEALSNFDSVVESQMIDYAVSLVKALDIYGTLSVEYFIVNNKPIFNEMAPRPHNSGHYTIEGCNISQFDNHIRAVTGSEVLDAKLEYESVMFNIIGNEINIDYSLCDGYFHSYNKKSTKPNRKMGHITFIDKDRMLLEEKIEKYLEVVL